METRKETFGRNYAVIQDEYGKIHEEQLGGEKISKLGYPDMGGNLYSELLPYKDWIKINNAQRVHEHIIN